PAQMGGASGPVWSKTLPRESATETRTTSFALARLANVSVALLVVPAGTSVGSALMMKVRGALAPSTSSAESIRSQGASLLTSKSRLASPAFSTSSCATCAGVSSLATCQAMVCGATDNVG